MTDYENEKRGVLWRNKKRTHDGQPTMRGECEIEGRKWQISAWTREIQHGANAGDKMLSLAFQEPYAGPTAADIDAQSPLDDNDGLPF